MSSNQDVIDEIKAIIRNGVADEVVPFVGAGTSFPLDLPSWEEMVKMYHNFVNCQIEFEKLKIKYREDWPRIADAIFDSSNGGAEEYREFMTTVLTPKSCNYTDLHLSIVRNFNKLLTTNYDIAFEKALNERRNDPEISEQFQEKYEYRTLVYGKNKLNAALFEKRAIAYLHGRRESELYVFRSREYDSAYSTESELIEFLRTVITAYPIIFLGFSFEDDRFCAELKKIVQKVNRRKEELKKIHQVTDPPEIIGLYALIERKKTIFKISTEQLNYFVDGDFSAISDIVRFVKVDEDNFELKPIEDFEMVKNKLSERIGQKSRDFSNKLKELIEAKKLMNFFEEIGLKVITYYQHTDIKQHLENVVGMPTTKVYSDKLPNKS